MSEGAFYSHSATVALTNAFPVAPSSVYGGTSDSYSRFKFVDPHTWIERIEVRLTTCVGVADGDVLKIRMYGDAAGNYPITDEISATVRLGKNGTSGTAIAVLGQNIHRTSDFDNGSLSDLAMEVKLAAGTANGKFRVYALRESRDL